MIKKRNILILSFFMIIFIFMGCTSTSEENPSMVNEEVKAKNYSDLVLMESKNNKIKVYNLSKGKRNFIEEIDLISDFLFGDKTYVYQKILSLGNTLVNNEINIISLRGEQKINSSYAYLDIKLSPDETKLAYRAFEKDNYESAKGMMIYNIEKHKEYEIDKNVLVSGNVYEWLNDNSIVYYGVKKDNPDYKGLFLYDFNSKEQKDLLKTDNKYILKIKQLNEKELMLFTFDGSSYELYLYNLDNSERKLLTKDIENIYYALAEEDTLVILGKDKNNNLSLFRIEKDGTMKRLVHGFPKNLNEDAGIGIDEEHNIYFIGYDLEKDLSQVYMIKKSDNSVNLIIDKEGAYHIYAKRANF